MEEKKDILWFQKKIAPNLVNYEISYKYLNEGDFGFLSQVEFNSDKLGGNIDFWGLGWLGIFVWDYQNEKQIMNVLFEPHQEAEKERALSELEKILLG